MRGVIESAVCFVFPWAQTELLITDPKIPINSAKNNIFFFIIFFLFLFYNVFIYTENITKVK